MLYDKRWDAKVETKADPWCLDRLISWLERQPRRERYCYTDTGHCLLAQYLTSLGYRRVTVSPFRYDHADGCGSIPAEFDGIALNSLITSRTFGGALMRARWLRFKSRFRAAR